MTQKLAGAVQKAADVNSNLRVGIVQSVDSATTLTINVGGGIITDMPFLASYSPAAGDNVTLARFDATWLVLGIIGPATLTVINGVIPSTGAAVGPTSAGTEMTITFLSSVTPVVVHAGHVYEFFMRCLTVQTTATDIFLFRARRDDPVSGTEIGFQRFSNNTTTGSWMQTIAFTFQATVDESFDLFWTVQRLGAGAGTLTANSLASTTWSYAKVTDMGFNTSVSGSSWSAGP